MPKILIVDDNKNNVVLIRKILTSAGHKVITAPDGQRAITRFRKDLPDLVITDLNMPIMDGIELIHKIRKSRANSHTPIIVSSATYRDVASKVIALETEGIDYLQLPFDSDKLLLKVKLLLANKRTHDKLASAKVALAREKDFLKTVLDSMHDEVSIIDVFNSTVIGANRTFLNTVGDKEETVKGEKCYNLAKQHNIACCISSGDCPLEATIETGEYAVCEYMHDSGNNKHRYYEVSTSPIKNQKGELIQVVHVTKDITERKHMENAIMNIAKGVSATVGDRFFFSVTKHLATILNADYAYIAEVDTPTQASTLSLFANGSFIDNIDVELAGTPCETVLSHSTSIYPSNVQTMFPLAHNMAAMQVEGYAGASLKDASGICIGLLSVMFRRPIKDIKMVESMLQIFAARASAELERKQADIRVRKSEEQFKALASNIPGITYRCACDPDWTMEFVSDTIEEISGYPASDFLNKIRTYASIIHPDDRKQIESTVFDMLKQRRPYTLEYRIITKSGDIRWIFEKGQATYDDKGKALWLDGVNLDNTERKRMEEQLQTAAITDELTGLLNRRGFYTFSSKQHTLANRNKDHMCLIYLDLNNLKSINDLLGHHAGDQALVDIANILKQTFRESDIVGRMGGDEFAVLLAEPSNYGVGEIVARHIDKNLADLNKKTERGYQLSLSIGSAYFDPEHPCSVDDLITLADSEMYKNKKRHKLSKLSVRKLDRQESENRTYARFTADDRFWAEIEDAGIITAINLSISGICLKTSKPLNLNSAVNIKIRSAKKECMQKGEIVWSHPSETDTSKRTTNYESGLKFLSGDIKSINSLKDFISGLFT